MFCFLVTRRSLERTKEKCLLLFLMVSQRYVMGEGVEGEGVEGEGVEGEEVEGEG